MAISKSTSTYINLVRWFAAAAVVLYHLQYGNFGPSWITRYFPSNGHAFVIVFFVISGFVISMVAERKAAIEFAIDRSARIYIVAIPALLVSLVLSFFFGNLAAGDRTCPLLTFLLNVTFLSQSWSLSRYPFQNAPYWSLSYEVMYYIVFGCFVYARRPYKWTLLALACALAGPKILALFPCWLLGVVAYKLRNIAKVTSNTGWAVAIGAPVFLALSVALGFKTTLNELSDRIAFQATTSEAFIKSWFLAAIFAAHLWGVCQVNVAFPESIERWSSKLAAMSYSLYLVHFPIIFLTVVLIGHSSTMGFLLTVLILIFTGCYLFSRLTEANTKRVQIVIKYGLDRFIPSRDAVPIETDARSP